MNRNRLGISTFIFASPFSDSDVGVFGRARDYGYDQVEIGIEDLSALTPSTVRRAAKDAGITLSVGGAFGPTRDISHETSGGRAEGLEYLLACIDFAAQVGATLVSGPMYSAVGKTRLASPEVRAEQRAWAADGIRVAADVASKSAVELAIEPLNRFETDLVNTVAQAIELCELVDRPNVGLALDTFHLNIEEKSIPAAILAAGSLLKNFQVCDNDRGVPGQGHIAWDPIFGALREIGYSGSIVVESFRPDVAEIARAVSLWRPVASSMEDFAKESAEYLREKIANMEPRS